MRLRLAAIGTVNVSMLAYSILLCQHMFTVRSDEQFNKTSLLCANASFQLPFTPTNLPTEIFACAFESVFSGYSSVYLLTADRTSRV